MPGYFRVDAEGVISVVAEVSQASPLRILLVTKNEHYLVILRDLLSRNPFSRHAPWPTVQWAKGYEPGLAALDEKVVDVVLVDYDLPPHDGLKFLDECTRLKRDVPLILLTDNPDYDLDLEAMRRGASDFFVKDTLTSPALDRSIRYAIKSRKSEIALSLSGLANRRILESAHCLLLITEVLEREGELSFHAVVSNEEMAQQIVPLDIPSHLTYAEALYYSKVREDRLAVDAAVCDALRAGRPGFQAEYRVTDSSGKITWLFEDTRIEILGPGHWRMTAVCSDVTDRKRIDDAAKSTELQMTALVRSALDAIIVMDQQGTVLEFNPAAESTFGYPREQVLGRPLVELLIPRNNRRRHLRGIATFLETGHGPVIGKRTEQVALHADGSAIPIELAVTAIGFSDRTLFIGFIRDITGRIKSEEEIRSQARRIEADRVRLANAQALAGTGSWSFDVPTQILSLSDEFFRIAGYEPQAFEVTWTNFLECVHWEDRSLVISSDMFDGAGQEPPPDQLVRIRRPDGEERIMLSRTRAAYDANGSRIRVDGTMADITDQKKAEADLDRFFSTSLDMLSIASVDGYFKRVNPAFEKTIGHTTAELLAAPMIDFVHPDERAIASSLMEDLSRGIAVKDFTCRYRCRDGSYRWLRWTTTPYGDQLYMVAHDVTPLREAEEALRRANADLELRVAERTAALEETNSRLSDAKLQADRANQAKSEFLSRMSHELRTPLNAILGFGQVLFQQDLGFQNNESVGYILKGGRHLLQLINEVLDLARVEAGHIEISLEVVEVDAVVRECLDLARTIAEENDVRLSQDDSDETPILVLADHRRLKQVILNLVSNAIKYNVPGGRVVVRSRRDGDSSVLIQVADTGLGLRPEDLPKLFTPFERLGADNSTIEGTGLGLSLSHRLVTLMGGTIQVESAFGVGSEFTVILPQAPRAAESAVSLSENSLRVESGSRSERISTVLCVEDNPLNIRLFQTIFARRPDIALLTAKSGFEGVEMAIRRHPDLILLDLNLPDTSGLEVLRTLRRNQDLRTVPIIIVSADATKGQITNLMAAGADGYLTKPLDVPELLRAIDSALDAATHEV